jgi:hypothetical protein
MKNLVKQFSVFVPITKIDVEKRLVYGVVASDVPDHSGEAMDYDSAKPQFAKWSENIEKVTEGKSVGNMRVMHGNKVAGKFTSISFNDDERQIEMCGKVVDDSEWKMCMEGAYTGFSMGGSYIKRWKDGDLTRYTPAVAEVSLVDNPCIPNATFSIVKADGSTEMKKFINQLEEKENTVITQPTNDQVAKCARDLAKAAGDESKWASYIEDATEVLKKAADPEPKKDEEDKGSEGEGDNGGGEGADINKSAGDVKDPTEDFGAEQVWKCKDGTTFKKKADALAHNDKLAKDAADAAAAKEAEDAVAKTVGPVNDLLKDVNAALDDKLGKKDAEDGKDQADAAKDNKENQSQSDKDEVEGSNAAQDDDKKTEAKSETADKAVKPLGVKKGLWIVSRAAEALDMISCLAECFASDQEWEGDTDAAPVVAQFRAWVAEGAKFLPMLVAEETKELLTGTDADDAIMELYAAPGKSHDRLVKSLGDSIVGKALQKAGARHSKKDAEHVQGMHDSAVALGATCGDAEKAVVANELKKMASERDLLTKTINGFAPLLKDILDRVKRVEAQPLPNGPMKFNVVGKSIDVSGDGEVDIGSLEEQVKKMSADERTLFILKLSQQNGRPLNERGQ